MKSEKLVYKVIIAVSIAIFIFLTWLIYIKPPAEINNNWVQYLPALNAFLNGMTSIFLVLGITLIKNKKVKPHVASMLAATFTSALFLISYITYHHFHGDSKFQGPGFIRYVYFFILISHIVLSAVQVPLILSTLYLAYSEQYAKHRNVERITFPIWLYVSITGVLIFVFLRIFN